MKFSKAICRKVPKSLVTGAQRIDDGHEPISYERACEQHEEYLKTLKSLGLDVILLEADEKYPDCVFVEDTAVVCGKKAIIPNIGHDSRHGKMIFILLSNT